MEKRFQSTLPTRGSDVVHALAVPSKPRISIHAPHEGERRFFSSFIHNCSKISIHAPHEGERLFIMVYILNMHIFQSTLPTRGSDVYVLS